MKYRYLSHVLGNEVPVYGNNKKFLNITQVKSILKGDSANVFQFTMENHWGTHVDAPAHFFNGAPSVCDYPPGFWIFSFPQVIELSACEDMLIDVSHLEGKIDAGTDLILLRTGFQAYRGEEVYSANNPGVHASVGLWLRENFSSVRAIGFDFISLAAYQHRDEGRKAHRAFLNTEGMGKPVLILEDMNLQGDLRGLKSVWAFPLLMKTMDSAPCTVIGTFGGVAV